MNTYPTRQTKCDWYRWAPSKADREFNSLEASSYSVEYRNWNKQAPSTHHTLYQRRPYSSVESDRLETTYHYDYCAENGQPQTRIDAMTNQPLLTVQQMHLHPRGVADQPAQSAPGCNARRAQTAVAKRRDDESVASCMVWQDTRTRDAPPHEHHNTGGPFVPHPPDQPPPVQQPQMPSIPVQSSGNE